MTFSLLSLKDEQSLEQELAFWDQEAKGIWHRLGRARAYNHYGMFTEAAREYEAALSQAPQSLDLLTRVIWAHMRTGNIAREEELIRRLPKGMELP